MSRVPLAEDKRGFSHATELSSIARWLNKREKEREFERNRNKRGFLAKSFYGSRRERLTIFKIISAFLLLVYNTTAVLLVLLIFAFLTAVAGFLIRGLLF